MNLVPVFHMYMFFISEILLNSSKSWCQIHKQFSSPWTSAADFIAINTVVVKIFNSELQMAIFGGTRGKAGGYESQWGRWRLWTFVPNVMAKNQESLCLHWGGQNTTTVTWLIQCCQSFRPNKQNQSSKLHSFRIVETHNIIHSCHSGHKQ